MLNRSASLAMSTSVLKALPDKHDIKRHSPSILYLFCRFFAIIILYAVAGTAVMKFVKKAEGKEVVPNISFWTQIPILIKVLYSFEFKIFHFLILKISPYSHEGILWFILNTCPYTH